MINATNDLTAYAKEKLTLHFENNEDFSREFMALTNFYSKKFNHVIDSEEMLTKFYNDFFEIAKSQIFQGYYLMLQIMYDEKNEIEDDFLAQDLGTLKDEIPSLLKQGFGVALESVKKTENAHKLSMWLVTNFENVYDLINQVYFDLLCTGSLYALSDECHRRGLSSSGKEDTPLLMGSPLAKTFISPQIYMVPTAKGEDYEMWDLRWWSSFKSDEKAGGATILNIESEESKQFILSVDLHQTVHYSEREDLVATLSALLSVRNNVPQQKIFINVSVVDDYILVQI